MTAALKYSSLNRLTANTGADLQRQFATLKARLVARYKLHTEPGRPEELIENGTHADRKVISLGCASGTVRIRKHQTDSPRVWADVRDFTPGEGWFREVYNYLDVHFGFVSPDLLAPAPPISIIATIRPRPIRDNPQA